MLELTLFLALWLAADPEPKPKPPVVVEAWAGHEVLSGKRKVPIYGEKETHTENFVIAEVRRSEGHIEVLQKVCKMDFRAIKGVKASMKRESVARLPKSHIRLDEKADGTLTAVPWTNGWGDEDLDLDDHPGVTVQIGGTSCSGEVYVSNQSSASLLHGRATEDGMSGEMTVRVKQRVLGASGLCLKLVAGDSDETQTGWFAYRRVPVGSSCRSLADKPWPVNATPKQAGPQLGSQ